MHTNDTAYTVGCSNLLEYSSTGLHTTPLYQHNHIVSYTQKEPQS